MSSPPDRRGFNAQSCQMPGSVRMLAPSPVPLPRNFLQPELVASLAEPRQLFGRAPPRRPFPEPRSSRSSFRSTVHR